MLPGRAQHEPSPVGALGPGREHRCGRLMRRAVALGLALVGFIAVLASPALQARGPAPITDISAVQLPPDAREMLATIRRGGPYRFRQDNSTFGNRERLLPEQPRGYYREYTVVTPGVGTRGARRIVAGGQPPVVFYYTDDHYRSFRRIRD